MSLSTEPKATFVRSDTPDTLPGWRDRLSARLPALLKITGVTSQPRPSSLGNAPRGKQVLSGTWFYGGALRQNVKTPWQEDVPGEAWRDAVHGFTWLDDLASLGTAPARKRAQELVLAWAERYGHGRGIGWRPGLTGMRQMRVISHAVFLLNGLDSEDSAKIVKLLGRQTSFLARRHRVARPGLRQISAACGLVHSAACLTGADALLQPALTALAQACAVSINEDGAVASRNPEELLEIFAKLTWTAALLAEIGQPRDLSLANTLSRLVPVLRALRMSDGALPQSHGGGPGQPGLLDFALRQSGERPSEAAGPVLGFARMNAGPVSLSLDAAAPPFGQAQGHASTLALEITQSRQPIIVNCGAGGHLGQEWRIFGRTTAAHSTLELLGYASSRLPPHGAHDAPLLDGPSQVSAQQRHSGGAMSYALSHDGWKQSHGLSHLRVVQMEEDGRLITGEDGLAALTADDRDILDRIRRARSDQRLAFAIRFHIHPDVTAALDMGGAAVSLTLPSGEVWVFRHGGEAKLSLKPSVYLDQTHIQPRACRQIVLSADLQDYGASISWSFARPAMAPRRGRSFQPRAPLSLDRRV